MACDRTRSQRRTASTATTAKNIIQNRSIQSATEWKACAKRSFSTQNREPDASDGNGDGSFEIHVYSSRVNYTHIKTMTKQRAFDTNKNCVVHAIRCRHVSFFLFSSVSQPMYVVAERQATATRTHTHSLTSTRTIDGRERNAPNRAPNKRTNFIFQFRAQSRQRRQ